MAQPGLATATTGAPVAAIAAAFWRRRRRRHLGLQHAVEAGRAAAAPAVAQVDALRAGAAQHGARADALGVEVVAGVVDGHRPEPRVARRAA